jgi:hypothetical protein
MDQPPQDRPAPRRLPGGNGPLPAQDDPPPGHDDPVPGHAAPGRAPGLRQVRRWSNWTAAALIAATAVTTGYFARASMSTAPAAAAAAAGARGTAPAAAGTHQPCLPVPVAISGGSAVASRTTVRSCGPGGPGAATTAPVVINAGHTGEGQDS